MPEIIHTTGITGFLGKTILPYLLKNFNAVINHGRQDGNKPITLFTTTEEIIHETKVEKNDIKKYESNLLLHMATNYNPFPKNSSEVKAVIEANVTFPIKVASSFKKVISLSSYQQLLSEKDQNIYSRTKNEFNEWCFNHIDQYSQVYLFDSFGSKDSRGKVVDVFLNNSLSGKDLKIPENEVVINLSHSSEVVESILGSLKLKFGNYCIKSKNNISLEKLAKLAINLTNSDSRIIKSGNIENHIEKIKNLPKNIYQKNNSLSLEDQLKNRLNEIQEA
ncbi:MAG: NAD-dependent epimerase/dehydratase family protein [Gammaproteobacteria bacterium]